MEIKKTISMHAFEMFVKASIQSEKPKKSSTIGMKSWIHEYCTYRFGMHRQSGHTTNCLYILPMYFPSITYVCMNQNMVHMINETIKELLYSDESYKKLLKETHVKIVSVDGFHRSCIGHTLDCVCIDVASLLSGNKIDNIINSICQMNLSDEFKLFLIE